MNSTAATVHVDGRQVTIQFEMPFVPGDVCITPRHAATTTVRCAPETRIDLVMDGQEVKATAYFGGAWYTANHSQCHGVAEFLPTKEAFLRYWMDQKADTFIDHLKWLERLFADSPETCKKLLAHRLKLLSDQIDERQKEMTAAAFDAAKGIERLKAELLALETGHG